MFRRLSKTKRLALLTIPLLCTACGTFNLGNVHQQAGKSKEQQQLDTLTCKDQARLAANSSERQAGAFLLGLTIVGAPVAFEMEKSKQREVFTNCMQERGYAITPAKNGQS